MIRENQKIFNRIQLAIDILALVISLVAAYFIRFLYFSEDIWHMQLPDYIRTLVILVPLYLFLYYFFGLYEPKRRKSNLTDALGIIKANAVGIIILLSILFLIKEVNYSRQVLLLFFVLNSLLLILERISIKVFLKSARSKGYNIKHILVIGAGNLGKQFIQRVTANPFLGYSAVGFVDDNVLPGKQIAGEKVLARINELEKVLNEYLLDEVIIALPMKEYEKLRYIIRICEKYGIRTQIIPDYMKYIPSKPLVDEIDGLPLINTRYVPLDSVARSLSKRIFDVLVSGIGLILCSLLFLIVGILIKIESPGPIFFSQERVGLNRKHFQMYKFRSMKVQNGKESDTQWTKKNDPRKTKIGTFIRKTSIDELPQLFNVFKGDMSLVGPRPERPHFVNQFKEKIPKYMVKHQVRPGITGWAQVNGWRGDTSIKKRIEYDLYYIENWTFSFDLKILFLTVFKGFVDKNAY